MGTADIEYYNEEDAKTAIKEYHSNYNFNRKLFLEAIINESEIFIEYANSVKSNKSTEEKENKPHENKIEESII